MNGLAMTYIDNGASKPLVDNLPVVVNVKNDGKGAAVDT